MTDSEITSIAKQYGNHFKPSEFLQERERLEHDLIHEVCRFRQWHGYSTLITSAFRHTGSHTTGLALDMILFKQWSKKVVDPYELWLLATTYPFLGVGLYFDWNYKGKPICGIHVDLIRECRQRPLRWIRVDGVYYYQSTKNGLFYNKPHTGLELDAVIKGFQSPYL
jgi:hypothetical protein